MAHTMRRYSQSVGIISALKQGFAERIAAHFDDAIKLNPNNINAQISKGTWHAEIVDKAPLIAGLMYSAYSKEARKHYNNALSLGSERIGELYEISYGLVLFAKKKDKLIPKKFSEKVKNGYGNSHLPLIRKTLDSLRNNKKMSPISISHVISSTKLIHALYSSEENNKWVHLRDMPISKRLGK